MTEVFDCTTAHGRADGVAAAVDAVTAGALVVLPTDTVYGIGCDAFSADAVRALLAAKGRGRSMPPPVLVPNVRTVDGLARDVPDYARALLERYWPGALTLVLQAQSSLSWDLGDTNGTVGLRMPADEVALQLLQAVGPMAVTSANRTGSPPATTAAQAREQLGDSVAVYLDGGPRRSTAASTVLDCTGGDPVVLRHGALPTSAVDRVVRGALDVPARPPAARGARRGPRVAGSRRRS